MMLSIARDLTERRAAEAALRQSEARLNTFNEAAFDGIVVTEHGTLVDLNPRMAQLLGYDIAELVGRKVSDVVAPEDWSLVQQCQASGLEQPYENRLVRKDGSVITVETQARHCIYLGRRMRVTVVHDVTLHKQMEAQLRQAQKMEAIGQLAGGVAHDFNNILAATLLHLGLLRQNPELGPGTKETIKEVERETLRAANLTRQLLLFSRRQLAQVEPLDMEVLIADLLKMLRRLLGENIETTFQDHAGTNWVCADAGMMEQLVMNLCINARDAMPDGGRLTLALTKVEIERQDARPNPTARCGQFVCLSGNRHWMRHG